MQKRKRIVMVSWQDSCEWGGWRDDTKDMKPSNCTTIGYLRKEYKSHVVIASSASEGNHCSHMVIPKGCITKITELKEA